jgi:hypothetical protein
MGLSGLLKPGVNALLARFNMRLDTLTAATLEKQRIGRLASRGHFDRPVFPLLPAFANFDAQPMLDAHAALAGDCARFIRGSGDPSRYRPDNGFFNPADAGPTYLAARTLKPRLWFEIGSGSSTRVVRQAIEDGGLQMKLVCVDPQPRMDIAGIADEIERVEIETLDAQRIIDRVQPGDVLFVDSSHDARTGGDVCHLFLNVVPKLKPGVVLHIHDVFLPYDYPRDWVERGWAMTEQYVVQAMLQHGDKFEVMWPGYHVQRSRPDLVAQLPFMTGGMSASLWLRVRE